MTDELRGLIRDGIPPLFKLMNDHNPYVQSNATKALSRLASHGEQCFCDLIVWFIWTNRGIPWCHSQLCFMPLQVFQP